MTVRYTAVAVGASYREVGDRIMEGREPVRFFEMELRRIGDSDWPAAGSIPPSGDSRLRDHNPRLLPLAARGGLL